MTDIKIITLTMNPAIDISASMVAVEPNRKLRCRDPSLAPGGGGINVARAIHKLGGEVKAIYPAGGPTGDMLEHLLEKEGIRQRRIRTEEWTRQNLAVMEEKTGNLFRFEMPGSPLDEQEWKDCLDIIHIEGRTADFLVASGSLPPGVPDDFYARLARITGGTDLKLVVDTSGESLGKLKGSGLFLLKPNLRELSELTGRSLSTEEEQTKAAKELVNSRTCEVLVLSLGADGALLVTRDSVVKFRVPKVQVKSPIGAGDSTVGGIVLALTRKLDLREAVIFGISSGTAAVMTPGTELCRREDAERIFGQMKEENGKRWASIVHA